MSKPTKKASRKAASKKPTTKYPPSFYTTLDELGYAQKMIEGTSQLLYFFFHCDTVHDLKEILHVNCGRVMALDACAIFMKKRLEELRQAGDALHEERRSQKETITLYQALELGNRELAACKRARSRRARRRR